MDEVPDAEIRRTDSTAVVKCKLSQETWHLVCKANTWIGDLKNCTVPEITDSMFKNYNLILKFSNEITLIVWFLI